MKSQTKIKGIGRVDGVIDCKRFYLPGVIINSPCPVCHVVAEWDGESEYVSDPVPGEPEPVPVYCETCDDHFEIDIVIDVTVSLPRPRK